MSNNVSQRKEKALTVLLEVLNDPLSVELTKRGLAGKRMCNRRALRVVLNRGCTPCLGGRFDSDSYGITGREADPGEEGCCCRVPLVPS